jgi:hypothetical protein
MAHPLAILKAQNVVMNPRSLRRPTIAEEDPVVVVGCHHLQRDGEVTGNRNIPIRIVLHHARPVGHPRHGQAATNTTNDPYAIFS